jgi:hypothetical protein
MDVVLLRWPAESDRRDRLADEGVPRLLLVEESFDPPVTADCLEDWVRIPAGESDVRLRVDGLSLRGRAHVPTRPDLDGHGVLRFADGWVPLPPVEARLTTALLDRYGAVVSRDALARAGWPDGAPGRNALDVHVLRLRRRIDSVGLAIRTVRSRGYLLEPATPRAKEA